MNNIAFVKNGGSPTASLAAPAAGHDVSSMLARLASVLQDLQAEVRQAAEGANHPDAVPASEIGLHAGIDSNIQMDVRRARSIRSLRKRIFGDDLFSGPAWDILLHLFESHVFQRRDTVGNVCDGTEIPAATALRWMNRLQQADLIRLRDDPLDGRRRYVELSNAGVDAMTRYFNGVAPHLIAA